MGSSVVPTNNSGRSKCIVAIKLLIIIKLDERMRDGEGVGERVGGKEGDRRREMGYCFIVPSHQHGISIKLIPSCNVTAFFVSLYISNYSFFLSFCFFLYLFVCLSFFLFLPLVLFLFYPLF